MNYYSFVHYFEHTDSAGAWYIVRYEDMSEIDDIRTSQAKVLERISDSRSLYTGPDGGIRHVESYPKDAMVRTEIVRRNVPLFELEPC